MARPGSSTKNTEKKKTGPKFRNPKKIPPKKCAFFRYFLGVFSRYFLGFFLRVFSVGSPELRAGYGIFSVFFSRIFRVGPSRGSVAGPAIHNLSGTPVPIFYFACKLFYLVLQRESNMHRIEVHHFASPFAPNFPVGENSGFIQEILQK